MKNRSYHIYYNYHTASVISLYLLSCCLKWSQQCYISDSCCKPKIREMLTALSRSIGSLSLRSSLIDNNSSRSLTTLSRISVQTRLLAPATSGVLSVRYQNPSSFSFCFVFTAVPLLKCFNLFFKFSFHLFLVLSQTFHFLSLAVPFFVLLALADVPTSPFAGNVCIFLCSGSESSRLRYCWTSEIQPIL